MSNKKKELLRTVKFVLFSISAGVIQIGSYTLLLEVAQVTPWLAYLISLVLSVLWNFTLNRKFTFQSANNIPIAMLKTAAFYLVFTPASTWWTKALTETAGWNAYVVEIATMLTNFVTEYLYQRFFVFGKSIDSATINKRGAKMQLSLEQIRSVACGAVSVAEEQDGIHLHRFTREQMDLYETRDPKFYSRTHSTAGIRLRFRTDSESLLFHACMTPQNGSRKYFAVEIFKNGKRIDTIENYSDADLSGDYTEVVVPTGEFSKNVQLGKGEKEICIYLPWNMNAVIKSLSLDEGATVIPVKPGKKLLCFGDSITQGYDALCPSYRYTSQLADLLNAEEFNKAIGGEIFWPELSNTKEAFVPDYITVAYGTNDWSKIPYKEFQENCKPFYENLSRNYPESRIFAITPIWRKDWEKETDFPSFDSVEAQIKEAAEHLPNVTVVEGFDFVPHSEKYFADLRLHPTDLGFQKYAKNLWDKIKTTI